MGTHQPWIADAAVAECPAKGPNWEEQCRQRFTRAYRGHFQALIDAAQRLIGCRQQAQDVVQDAFFKLWQTAPKRRVDDEVGYLFRSVRHLAIDRLRVDSPWSVATAASAIGPKRSGGCWIGWARPWKR